MNNGATVCASCGRRQPVSERTLGEWRFIAAAVLVALVVVSSIGYFLHNKIERDRALNDARIAAAFCNRGRNFTSAFAEESVQRLHDYGMSWAAAAWTFRWLIDCNPSDQ